VCPICGPLEDKAIRPSTRRRFLKQSVLATSAFALSCGRPRHADASIRIFPDEPIEVIQPEMHGHFLEHLGGVIYDGVWVGEDSKVPNINGIRKAFVDAMRAIEAPVIRWPGGCFAEQYDWRDAIGPRHERPLRTGFSSNWDPSTHNMVEPNAYGTHEFMQTCRLIGAEAYLAANMRSLPARDFYEWVEYCNAPFTPLPTSSGLPGGVDTLAALRAKNGSPEPFNVRYWGVGNESWGCGGDFTPQDYAAEFRRYVSWVPAYDGKPPLRIIACGAGGVDREWTKPFMHSIKKNLPFGLSTHYYVSGSQKFAQGSALDFSEADHYDLLARATHIETIVKDAWSDLDTGFINNLHYSVLKHPSMLLHSLGHGNGVRLIVDEWGAWYGRDTSLGEHIALSQQSTMRDALLTGITLDIFHRNAEKIAMANVALTINALHSLMLAQGDQFTVTPTYHVFKMYMAHKGGTSLRTEFDADTIRNPIAHPSQFTRAPGVAQVPAVKTLAGLSGSASIKGKTVTLSVVNPHLHQAMTTQIAIAGRTITGATGTMLTEPDIHAHNDFAHPDAVHTQPARTGSPAGGKLIHTFPPASVTALTLTLA
jgi:alpha-N-arabinofuranosidase